MINGRRYAFTLIELITVMAITAILLTIITVPMVETFKATRLAQAYGDAQDKARILTERLSKEIGEASAVRDIEGLGGRVSIVCPIPLRGVDDNNTVVTTPGGYVKIGMNYTKLDLVLPQKVGQKGPGGAYIDPVTGKEDPTLHSAKGQVQLPLAPGTTIKRYWIGLSNPFGNYNNPYDGFLMAKGSPGRDNLFVLYSAEVQPVKMVEIPVGSGNFIPQVNTDFFDAVPDGTNRNPIYDDPDFFLATGAQAGAPVNNDAKAVRIQHWKAAAKIETEVTRYDLIQPQYDKSSHLARLTNTTGVWSPRVTPLVLFRPSHVEGDGADAQVAATLGNEVEGSDQIGSEVFQGQFAMMSNLSVRTYGLNWQSVDPYQIARKDATNLGIYFVQPGVSGIPDTTIGSGTMLYDITAYEDAFRKRQYDAASRYPFSVGLDAANVVSAFLSSPNPAFRANFMPFTVNTTTGKIIASFNIGEVGDFTKDPNAAANLFSNLDPNPFNFPQVPAQGTVASGWTNTDTSLTPSNDPALVAGVFSDAPFWDTSFLRYNINRTFNKVWADAQAGRNGIPSQFGDTGGAHRFIDLR
ncbi:MAG: prepilin-type N-terminal cleavage/methylation domain-containing protein, partial [Armatimonadota bacterium]